MKRIAFGLLHAFLWVLLCTSGELGRASQVIAWGDNTYDQTNVPPGLTNALAVAGGFSHSIALNSDGTVIAWGGNNFGQTNVPSYLTNAVAIAAGWYHSLALKSDGAVTAWGAGMVNSGSAPNFGQSLPPTGLTNVVAIAAGRYHSLALRADGALIAWGDNTYGQTNVPANLSNLVAIAAGGNFNLALTANGSVTAWGDNSSNQCNVPVGLRSVIAIAAGDSESLALMTKGQLVAWGSQTNVPLSLGILGIPAATIISVYAGTFDTSVTKASAKADGNCVVEANGEGPLIVDGGTGLAILGNGEVNIATNYCKIPASAISKTNGGTANQIPDYTYQGTANTLFDIRRFIAVSDLTTNGYAPSGNNHFTNIATFMIACNTYTNFTNCLEGVIAVDVTNGDPNLNRFQPGTGAVITNGPGGQTLNVDGLVSGINVRGTLVFNFIGGGWLPYTAGFVTTMPININPANLSGLVATNTKTYPTAYPPVYNNPNHNPANVDITSKGYASFTAADDLPALLHESSEIDMHGPIDICGTMYTPCYMEIENTQAGQTQYVNGSIIVGGGIYIENNYQSVSVFTSSSKGPAVAISARASNDLALRAQGAVTGWENAPAAPPGLSNVVAIAAGVSHSLALIGSAPPPVFSRPILSNPKWNPNGFSFSLPTRIGKVYRLECANSPASSNWMPITLDAGNGSTMTFSDPNSTNSQRFYRITQW